jgi:branched-subunit amino acid aminotransferase/4-amino-4-deoxychorismate lyase
VIEHLPFDAPAVERGVGFFETVLLVGRHAIHWNAHLARLLATLERFELPAPARNEIEEDARCVLDAAPQVPRGAERGLRIAWVAAGADLEARAAWRLHVSTRPIPEPTRKRREGAHVVTLPAELRRDTPSVKSTSYFASVMGLRHARRQGGDEGLFRGSDGGYLEGTSTGLVAWQPGVFRVADHAMLGSVTAAAFLDGRGSPGRITADDIRRGALLLGSLTKAVPIVTLDGEPCAQPDEMGEDIRAFNGRLVSEPAWQTPL